MATLPLQLRVPYQFSNSSITTEGYLGAEGASRGEGGERKEVFWKLSPNKATSLLKGFPVAPWIRSLIRQTLEYFLCAGLGSETWRLQR